MTFLAYTTGCRGLRRSSSSSERKHSGHVPLECAFRTMCLVLILLPHNFHLSSALVNHRVLIQDVTRNLASKGTFALYPMGCHHSSYSEAPASIINIEVLMQYRYPRRIVMVICDSNAIPFARWSNFYKVIIRNYGAQYFTLIDFTIQEVFEFPRDEIVAAPFSCVLYKDEGDYFEIHVDSDFHGERQAWKPIIVSRQEVADGEIDLSRLLIFNESVHNSQMSIYVSENLDMRITPRYVTNYSKPGQAVWAGNGVVTGYTWSHFPNIVPILMDNQVAIYLNPKTLSNDLILLLPFSPEIWLSMVLFSAIIAFIMTQSIRYAANKSKWPMFVENVICAFSHMFTTLEIPQPSRFKSMTAAIATIMWTVLCIIPQTGYKSSLASILQKPPREEKFSFAQIESGWTNQTVNFMEPDFVHFMNVLRSGRAWYDAAISAKVLQSIWGLTTATYTTRINPYRFQTRSLQCLSRRGVVHACRSLQHKMRQLFETDLAYFYMSRIRRSMAAKTHDTSEHDGHDASELKVVNEVEHAALKFTGIRPYFWFLALGGILSSIVLMFEIVQWSIEERRQRKYWERLMHRTHQWQPDKLTPIASHP